ncbi:MAG: CDP-paratose 2-epimerase [Solirubrobacteraceae bacterium]|jgi:CDP-paratose 2-epimerase|nr:CDP-paratose 2-epimerase [Solirubrobacteraceae bacterium]
MAAVMRVLITGGAGFIGANVAVGLAARHPDWELLAVDNLRRSGSELNLSRLRAAGVRFRHADVRLLDDLLALGDAQAILECSAEPSVLAGTDGSPDYLVRTNLLGAYHCLELARRTGAFMLFLSTSRVYPVAPLRALRLEETATRLALAADQPMPGASAAGINEEFGLEGARTLYGTTKLAAEHLIAEYRETYGLRAVIDRCGVIAGPWQMGRVDQGVFTYWMLAHHFARPLRYIGFGGQGKQVRDLLHVADLLELLDEQLGAPERWDGTTVNVGGGADCSLSLAEATALCVEITGRRLEIGSAAETRPGDVPHYVSDCRRLFARSTWRPRHGAREILADIHAWIAAHEAELAHLI